MSEFATWRCIIVRVVRMLDTLQHSAPKSTKKQVELAPKATAAPGR